MMEGGMDNTILIALAEAKSELSLENDLLQNIKDSMSACKNHWLVTDDDDQFRASVGAVMAFYGEGSDEYKRLKQEMKTLTQFSAMMTAQQAGLNVGFDGIDVMENPIGLLKLWKALEATP